MSMSNYSLRPFAHGSTYIHITKESVGNVTTEFGDCSSTLCKREGSLEPLLDNITSLSLVI
ncbi:ORF1180 [White spot syndrome virus]|uniref:ORF1180 n=1 Tax=White spot syndrome virus TaxID=342409 RepID=A0A2D3I758_9VIRU|nr:ORF1180 [White spot syndrome virus]